MFSKNGFWFIFDLINEEIKKIKRKRRHRISIMLKIFETANVFVGHFQNTSQYNSVTGKCIIKYEDKNLSDVVLLLYSFCDL